MTILSDARTSKPELWLSDLLSCFDQRCVCINLDVPGLRDPCKEIHMNDTGTGNCAGRRC